jgi:hypothetical protein
MTKPAVLVVLGLIGMSSAAQQSSGDMVRTVAIKLADGGILRCSTGARPIGGGYSPIVLTIPGVPTSRDGLDLSMIEHTCGRQGADVTVTIALRYGPTRQHRIPVVTVVAHDGVTLHIVEELRAFGVKPEEISIETWKAPVLHVPAVESVSSGLPVVSAEVEGPPEPGYVFTLRNTKTQAVMEIKWVETDRDGAIVVTGGQRHPDGTPVIQPGDTDIVRLGVILDSRGWLPADRFQITSVKWADGTEEHSPSAIKR